MCFPGYLWWNGYILANRINSHDAQGKPNGYMGVPSNYKPATAFLVPQGLTALLSNAPANTALNNGTVQRETFDDGLHLWRNQLMAGPLQWFQDVSLFKVIPINERATMRFNMDFFNVLNNPTGVAGTGFMSTRNSGRAARMMQLALGLPC